MKRIILGIIFMLMFTTGYARGSHSHSSHHSSSHSSHRSSYHSSRSYSKPFRSYSRPKSSSHSFFSSRKSKVSGPRKLNKTYTKTKSSPQKLNKSYTKRTSSPKKLNKTKIKSSPRKKVAPKRSKKKAYKPKTKKETKTVHHTTNVIHKHYHTRNSYYSHRTSYYGGYHNPYSHYGYYHSSYGMFDTLWLVYVLDNMHTNAEMRRWYYANQSQMSDFKNSQLVKENAQLRAELSQADGYASDLHSQGVDPNTQVDVEGSQFALSQDTVDANYKPVVTHESRDITLEDVFCIVVSVIAIMLFLFMVAII